MSGGGGDSQPQEQPNTSPATPIPTVLPADVVVNPYGNMFAKPSNTYVPGPARSNFDPAKAQALADKMYAYHQDTANRLSEQYQATLTNYRNQQITSSQEAARKAAEAEAARKAAQQASQHNWLSAMLTQSDSSNSTIPVGATGGLASLQGFER